MFCGCLGSPPAAVEKELNLPGNRKRVGAHVQMNGSEMQLAAGTRLAEYEIQAVLGQGGFGITYAAFDWHLRCHRAIKELLPADIACRNSRGLVVPLNDCLEESWRFAREKFIHEAGVLKSFNQPSIVRVHRLLEMRGTLYMVMDYIVGTTLENLLREEGLLGTKEEVLDLLAPVLHGLAKIHARRFHHLDIKPQNILVGEETGPVLIDFGSARRITSEQSSSCEGFVTGGYSALELYGTSARANASTDIYSLGALIHRAIAGRPPLAAPERVAADCGACEVLAARDDLRHFDLAFLRAVDWALELAQHDRPQSIEEWRDVLTSGNLSLPSAEFSGGGTSERPSTCARELVAPAREAPRKSTNPPITVGAGGGSRVFLILVLAALIVLGVTVAVVALVQHLGSSAVVPAVWGAPATAFRRGTTLCSSRLCAPLPRQTAWTPGRASLPTPVEEARLCCAKRQSSAAGADDLLASGVKCRDAKQHR